MNAWNRFNKWEGSGCVWFIVILLIFKTISDFSSNTGPFFPFDTSPQESAEIKAEMTVEFDSRINDLCVQDILNHTPPEYSRCGKTSQPDFDEIQNSSCPQGCIMHLPGCDIKGNISVDTGEKIYHLPGQEYYNVTVINPDYGERWFCTEIEAHANGFRRAYK